MPRVARSPAGRFQGMTPSQMRPEVSELRLRPIEGGDAARIHEWASQPEACRYQPWGPNTLAETHSFVGTAVKTWSDRESPRRVWVAELPNLGVLGIGELKRISGSCREIAYAVHMAFWGRGLGSEIGRLLLVAAFSDPSTERVQATCDPRNVGSAAVLRRIGMTLEGRLRHTHLVRDGWRDSLMHSVLREERQPGDRGETSRVSGKRFEDTLG